jgi:hypothetical protein
MQSPLIGCGKLATNGCGIWFDDETDSVVTGTLKQDSGYKCFRRVPAHCDFLGNMPRRCAIPRNSPKFFNILLRIEMKNYSHHKNGNVLNQSSMDINFFRTNLSDEI